MQDSKSATSGCTAVPLSPPLPFLGSDRKHPPFSLVLYCPPPPPAQALIRSAVGTSCQPWQRIAVLQVLRSFCAYPGLLYR